MGITEKEPPNKQLVYNSSVKITVGTVVPHPLAGWEAVANGATGVSSSLTTDQTIILVERTIPLSWLKSENSYEEMEGIAKVKVDFIINSVQDMEISLAYLLVI